jgi:imidazolonepropionase-like amidohydrolase
MIHVLKRALFAVAVAAASMMGLAAAAPADGVTVRAGRLVDVVSGRVLTDQAVRIEGGRFVSVRPWSDEAAKRGPVIDWSAHTVLPGLMDMHTHLVGDIQSSNIAAPLLSTAARDVLAGAACA